MKRIIRLNHEKILYCLLAILFLFAIDFIPTAFSAPNPIPKPISFSWIGRIGSDISPSAIIFTDDVLLETSEKAGRFIGSLSKNSPETSKQIFEKTVQEAIKDPRSHSLLTAKLGKSGAEAFVANQENGKLIVKAVSEGMKEVFSQAIKEEFSRLRSKISSLAKSFRKSIISKVPKRESQREAKEAAAIEKSLEDAANTPTTWDQSFTNSLQLMKTTLASLGTKVYHQGVGFSLQAVGKLATISPKAAEILKKATDGLTKQIVDDAVHQQELAKAYGQIIAREFLNNPRAAAHVFHDAAKGAAPVLFKHYMQVFKQFLKDLGLLLKNTFVKGIDVLKKAAEKVFEKMKGPSGGPEQTVRGAISSTNPETNQVGSEIARVRQEMIRKRSLIQKQHMLHKRDFVPSLYDNLTPADDPFLRDLNDTIVQLEQLGYMIYFKSFLSPSNSISII